MGVLYLMLPVHGYHVSQVHHVWPVGIHPVGDLRVPTGRRRAGAWLGVAAGSAFFPFLLFPLWFGFYRGRGAGPLRPRIRRLRAGLSLGVTAALLLLERRTAAIPEPDPEPVRLAGLEGPHRRKACGRGRTGPTGCRCSSLTWPLSC